MTRTTHTSPDLPAHRALQRRRGGPRCGVDGRLRPEHPQSGAVPDGVGAQTEQVIDNLEAALRVVGSGSATW